MTAILSDSSMTLKIVAIVFTGLLTLLLPLGAQLFAHKKGGHWRAFWAGAATFFVAVMLAEQAFHTAILTSPLGEILLGNIGLYALYGAAAAALFEETARYISFSMLRRFLPSTWDGVSFGLGHGGCEALLLVGLTMVNNLVVLWAVAHGDQSPAYVQAAQTLLQTPASLFLLSALERLSAILLHVLNSVLVYQAVRQYNIRYYLLALAFHFVLDFAAVVLQAYLPSVLLLEAVVLLLVVLMAWLGLRVLRPLLQPVEEKPEKGSDEELN